jgi:pimeloyl-ACP methyl ester carboxylesterase
LIMQADPRYGGVLADAQARAALSRLPRGSLQFVPGAGHAIHATRPVEFTRLLLDFTSLPSARL